MKTIYNGDGTFTTTFNGLEVLGIIVIIILAIATIAINGIPRF